MARKKTTTESTVEIIPQSSGRLELCLLGTSPLMLNRMAMKAQQQLLLPSPRKSVAARAKALKHEPLAEFRAAPYTTRDAEAPTFLLALSTWFANATREACLDIEGVSKAMMQRNFWCDGERIPLYGVPFFDMRVVRCADMAKTPDIRSRPVLPEWACRISVSYRTPLLREHSVVNLIAAAGTTPGVGEYRVGKGGTYGQFELVEQDDARFQSIVKNGGRAAQIAAMDMATPYNEETEELFGWFRDEVQKRGYADPCAAPFDAHEELAS